MMKTQKKTVKMPLTYLPSKGSHCVDYGLRLQGKETFGVLFSQDTEGVKGT